MQKLNRRNFLNRSFIFGSIPLFGNFRPSLNLETDLVYDQEILFSTNSGNFKSSHTMGVGILKVSKINKIIKSLSELRQQYSYYSQIKYHSNDRFKLQICKDIIDIYLDEEIRLYIKVVDNPKDQLQGLSPSQRMSFRINLYKDLLLIHGSKDKVKVFFKTESPFGPSRDFIRRVSVDENLKMDIKTVKAKEDDIIQVMGFLTGTIMSDMRGLVQNPIKLELINYLKDKLGIDSFTPTTKVNKKLFMI